MTFDLSPPYNGHTHQGGEFKSMIKFYDVKLRKEVHVEPTKVQKVEFPIVTKSGKKMVRYAFKAKTEDGRNLTKFVSKEDYDKMK